MMKSKEQLAAEHGERKNPGQYPRGEQTVPFLRTPYNYDRNQASDESGLNCTDPSLTKQADAEDADINVIMKRFNATGQMPQAVKMPTYGDFTNIPDFHQAQNAIRAATESFMRMPADVRAEFHNDPHEFVAFCSDEKNRDRAERLGLLVPPKPTQKAPDTTPDPDTGELKETPKKKGVT